MNAYVIIYFSLRLFFAFFLSLFLPLIIVVEHSNIRSLGPLIHTFHFSSSQNISPLHFIVNSFSYKKSYRKEKGVSLSFICLSLSLEAGMPASEKLGFGKRLRQNICVFFDVETKLTTNKSFKIAKSPLNQIFRISCTSL